MPTVTAEKKSKQMDKQQQHAAAGQPPAPPMPPAPPDAAEPSPTPPPTVRPMTAHSGYAAASAKLAELNASAAAADADLAAVRAELGDRIPASAIDIEALELVGEMDPGGAGRLAELLHRQEVLTARCAVLHRAVAFQQPKVAEQRELAYREVMRAVGPQYKHRLLAHARDVVAAARSRLEIVAWIDAVTAEVPSTSGGLPDHSYLFLGDLRDHNSNVPVWLSELIAVGLLEPDEPFLAEIRMLAVRDGRTVIDRPSIDPMTQGRPTPPKQSILGAVGAAVQRGLGAVAGLVAGKSRPDADALPPEPQPADTARRRWLGGPKPSPEPGARTIRILKDVVSTENEWRRGWVGPWAAADAANMVRAGLAEWADGAEPAAAEDAVEDGAAAE